MPRLAVLCVYHAACAAACTVRSTVQQLTNCSVCVRNHMTHPPTFGMSLQETGSLEAIKVKILVLGDDHAPISLRVEVTELAQP